MFGCLILLHLLYGGESNYLFQVIPICTNVYQKLPILAILVPVSPNFKATSINFVKWDHTVLSATRQR